MRNKNKNNRMKNIKDGEEIRNWNHINPVFGRVFEGNRFWALREKRIKISDFQVKLNNVKKLISEINSNTQRMSNLLPNFDSKKPAKSQANTKTPAKKTPAKLPRPPSNTPVSAGSKPKSWRVKCGLCPNFYVMFPSLDSRMKYANHILTCGANDHCGASNAPSSANCGICHAYFRLPGQRKDYDDHVRHCGMIDIQKGQAETSGKKNQRLITETIPFHVERQEQGPKDQDKEVDSVQEKLDMVSMEEEEDSSFFRKIALEAREEVLNNDEADHGLSQSQSLLSIPSTQPSQDVTTEEKFVEDINPGDASTQDPTTPGGTKKRVRISGGGSPKLESKIRKKGDDTMATEMVDTDILLRRAKYFLDSEKKKESISSTGSSVVFLEQVDKSQKKEEEAENGVSGAQAFSQNDNTVVEVPADESTFLEDKAEDEMTKMREHMKKLQKSLNLYISKSDLLTNELAEAHLTIEKLQEQLRKIQEGVDVREKDIMKLRKENKNLLETLRAMNEKILNLSQINDRKVLFENSEIQKKKIEEKNRQIQELNEQCNQFMKLLDSREDYETLFKINEETKKKVKLLEKKVEQLEEENARLTRSQDVSMSCNSQVLKTAALQNGELQAYKRRNVDCMDPNCLNRKICGLNHRRKELKDVPCKFLLRGYCKDGDDCLYSHHDSYRGEPDGDGQDEPMELDLPTSQPQPQPQSQAQEPRTQRMPRSEKRGFGGWRGRGRGRRSHSYHNDLHHTQQSIDSPARRRERIARNQWSGRSPPRSDRLPSTAVPRMPPRRPSRTPSVITVNSNSSISSNHTDHKPRPRVRFGSDGYPIPVPAVSRDSGSSISSFSSTTARRRSSDTAHSYHGSSTTEPYSPQTDWTPYSPECLDKDNNFGQDYEEEEVFVFDEREDFRPRGPRRGRGDVPNPQPLTGPRSKGQKPREDQAVVEQRIQNTAQRMKEPRGILLDRIRQERREVDHQNPWPRMDRGYPSDPQTHRLRVNQQIQRSEQVLRSHQDAKKEQNLKDFRARPGGR